MRRTVVERPSMSGRNRNRNGRKPKWRIVETKVKGNAAVQVSELPLKVPRYSFKVGSAHFPDDIDHNSEPEVGPRLSIFNVLDAVDLLKELADKYTTLREERIEELEERKARWQEGGTGDETDESDEDDYEE